MKMFPDKEISVILDAVEPMELMRNPTREDVWIRNVSSGYLCEVEIRGTPLDVYDFISNHWDTDTAKFHVLGVE